MPTRTNPTHRLDFDRFSSDALRALYLAELQVLRRITPDVPVTTNFTGFFKDADYWTWAVHVDYVSDDHYPCPAHTDGHLRAAATRDLVRSLGDGKPWILMEQTSAVNWRPRNAPKPARVNRVHSLQAMARGADGVLFFQWRQAKAGAEKFHPAVVPHGGENTRIFREATALGAELAALSGDERLLGSEVPASVAILFDWDSWRAIEQDSSPTQISYVDTVLSWYRPFLRRGVTIDFVPPGADLTGYDLVVAPVLQVATQAALTTLRLRRRRRHAACHLPVGHPRQEPPRVSRWLPRSAPAGAGHRDRGVRTAGRHRRRPPGYDRRGALPVINPTGDLAGEAELWQEIVTVHDADVLSRFGDGFAAGGPAVTCRRGTGSAWYVATQPTTAVLDEIVARVLDDAGVTGLIDEPTDGVEAVRRGDLMFLFNHTTDL